MQTDREREARCADLGHAVIYLHGQNPFTQAFSSRRGIGHLGRVKLRVGDILLADFGHDVGGDVVTVVLLQHGQEVHVAQQTLGRAPVIHNLHTYTHNIHKYTQRQYSHIHTDNIHTYTRRQYSHTHTHTHIQTHTHTIFTHTHTHNIYTHTHTPFTHTHTHTHTHTIYTHTHTIYTHTHTIYTHTHTHY